MLAQPGYFLAILKHSLLSLSRLRKKNTLIFQHRILVY